MAYWERKQIPANLFAVGINWAISKMIDNITNITLSCLKKSAARPCPFKEQYFDKASLKLGAYEVNASFGFPLITSEMQGHPNQQDAF